MDSPLARGAGEKPRETAESRSARWSLAAASTLLHALNAELLSHASATLTLERWCEAQGFTARARIAAVRSSECDKSLPPDGDRHLALGPHEAVRYRHVRLVLDGHVLAEADNWYVPSRLSAAMNRQLDSSDMPFGKVIQSLGFQRQTLQAHVLWPQPRDASQASEAPGIDDAQALPEHVLRHRAVLYDRDMRPISFLTESYTRQVLALTSSLRENASACP